MNQSDRMASAPSPAGSLLATLAHEPELRPDPLELIVVSAEAFWQSYVSPESHPEAARGLRALAEAGFQLPLTYLSPGFRQLSTLAVVAQFSGNVGKKFPVGYHYRTLDFAGQNRVMENLNLFPVRGPSEAASYHYLMLQQNSSLFGRLLIQLGVRHGQHRNSGVTVPHYLINLATAYANSQTKFDTTASSLLKDAVAAMFFTSMAQHTPQDSRLLRLPAQTSRAGAINLATRISYIIQSVFPREEIDFLIVPRISRSRILPDKTPIYNPVVRFSTAAYGRMASALGP